MPPKGIQYFSIDDQIIEEMKAEGLIEERRPTEAPVVVEEDPHARFDERAGLLNSKHWRRAEGEKAPSPRRKSDDHLRGSWGSLCTRCASGKTRPWASSTRPSGAAR